MEVIEDLLLVLQTLQEGSDACYHGDIQAILLAFLVPS